MWSVRRALGVAVVAALLGSLVPGMARAAVVTAIDACIVGPPLGTFQFTVDTLPGEILTINHFSGLDCAGPTSTGQFLRPPFTLTLITPNAGLGNARLSQIFAETNRCLQVTTDTAARTITVGPHPQAPTSPPGICSPGFGGVEDLLFNAFFLAPPPPNSGNVPELGSLTLFGSGALGLAYVWRRRRR